MEYFSPLCYYRNSRSEWPLCVTKNIF